MASVTKVEIKESLEELVEQLQQVKAPQDKERLQVLYWLKQEHAPRLPRRSENIATRWGHGYRSIEQAG